MERKLHREHIYVVMENKLDQSELESRSLDSLSRIILIM